MQTVFISDTHGFKDTWLWLFEEMGLTDYKGNWTGDETRVIHVGDHVDRGQGAVDLYHTIKAFPNIIRLAGNHDIQYFGGPICGRERKVLDELAPEMKQDVFDGTLNHDTRIGTIDLLSDDHVTS